MREKRKEILKTIKGKEIQRAKDQCKKYIEIEEDDARVYVYLGYCHTEDKEYEESLRAYERARKCSNAEEVELEIVQGIGRVLVEEKKHFEKSEEEQNKEEEIVARVAEIYREQNKSEQAKKYLMYLLEMLRYAKIEKYRQVFEKNFNIGTEDTDKLDLEKREKLDVIAEYVDQRLKDFASCVKTLVETGGFSRPRSEISKNIRNLVDEQKETEKYIRYAAECGEEEEKALVEKIFENFVFYLGMKVYVDGKYLEGFAEGVMKGKRFGVPLERHRSFVQLVASDFLDMPLVIGTADEYKPFLYNVLSPTVVLLRFKEQKAVCYEMYAEMEEETGRSYRKKKQMISALQYQKRIEEKLQKDTEYRGEEELEEIREKYGRIHDASALMVILEEAARISSFAFIEEVLKKAERSGDWNICGGGDGGDVGEDGLIVEISDVGDVGDVSDIPNLHNLPNLSNLHNINGEHACVDSKNTDYVQHSLRSTDLFEASRDIVPYEKLFLIMEIDEMSVRLLSAHENIVHGRADKGLTILMNAERPIQSIRRKIRSSSELSIDQEISEKLDQIYGYAKFLTEYLNRIILLKSTPSKCENSSSTAPKDASEQEYFSEYSEHALRNKEISRTTMLDMFRHPVDRTNHYQRHMNSVTSYEKDSCATALAGLGDLHQERKNDYYLVGDLAHYLSKSRKRDEALVILEEYLRGRVYRNETHLFALSLRLLRETKRWHQMEMRCKELLTKQKTYRLEIALAEALSHQKKYTYALKIVQDVIRTEIARKSTDKQAEPEKLRTAQLFEIYLYIKSQNLALAEDRINAISKEDLNRTERTVLERYRKYAQAHEIRRAVHAEGITHVKNLISKYGNTSAIEDLAPPADKNTRNNQNENRDAPKISASEHAAQVIECYVVFLRYILTGASVPEELSVPEDAPRSPNDQERQEALITTAKLHLVLASAKGALEDPRVHKTVAGLLKQAASYGVSKTALETELVTRIVREEEIEGFYRGEKTSEETSAARVMLSLTCTPEDLPVAVREYARSTSLADAALMKLVGDALARGVICEGRAEDLETVFLHLCRRYRPEDAEVAEMYAALKSRNLKNTPGGD